jgi:hypothetical protein
MRARIGTVLSLALVFGLLTPRASDRPLAAVSEVDGGRAASPGARIATLPAAAPVLTTPVVAMGPFALPTVAWPASVAFAEADAAPESERLAKELLHTDRLISVLRPKVFRSGNSAAQEHFTEAIRREGEAREAYDLRLYARSSRLTREARSLAREAAVMVGPPEEDPVYVSRAIDHAEDALRLADGPVRGVARASVTKRYESLEKQLAGARDLFKAGEIKRAHTGAVAVRDGVLDLLRDCDDLPVSPDTASKALEGAERAIDRASKELGKKPSPSALRLQKEALGQLTKARSAFARKEYRDAVIHSKLVERNLESAVAAQRNSPKGSVKSDA